MCYLWNWDRLSVEQFLSKCGLTSTESESLKWVPEICVLNKLCIITADQVSIQVNVLRWIIIVVTISTFHLVSKFDHKIFLILIDFLVQRIKLLNLFYWFGQPQHLQFQNIITDRLLSLQSLLNRLKRRELYRKRMLEIWRRVTLKHLAKNSLEHVCGETTQGWRKIPSKKIRRKSAQHSFKAGKCPTR